MIDYFSLALTHALLAIACWRLLLREDLDTEAEADAEKDGPRA